MNEMKMYIPYSPDDLFYRTTTITQDVYDALELTNFRPIVKFIWDNFSTEQFCSEMVTRLCVSVSTDFLKRFLSINEETITFQRELSEKCGYQSFVYSVEASLDVDSLLDALS